MGVEVKPGTRLRSSVCAAEVVVVKAPAGELDLRCGGHPLVPHGEQGPQGLPVEPGFDGDVLIGKRYTDGSGDIELLCTKAGASALSVGDEVLERKDAKPLPSSD
ncbi:MAG TPA: hypothetical protein VFI47_02500 [Acidimicrobiales bacterium]|nr:hypothetical protein [Acidimicrobiales bacterium]